MTAPAQLLPSDLVDGMQLVAEGLAIGADITTGRSLMCKQQGVRSEVEYKRKMMCEGRIMASMNIGMQTWADTARALERIHTQAQERGFRIDRYQMQLDRRMGLPRQFWTRAAKETGPMLETHADWQATSQVVPIQPHLGDMMIGSPASVDNACRALEAGVNYIGNMSQFNWKYPGWPGDDAEQTGETVKALGVMASKIDDDAMVHSYLDDGFPAQFTDFCCYVGWAMFERYVVDELIGARLSVAYGGLSHNPVSKAAMIIALERITPNDNMNAFYHSNTTAYAKQLDENFAVLSIDDLYMMLAQRHVGGGAAILSVPVTEAVRIPTWEEIVQAQTVARRVAGEVDRLKETLDWPRIEALSDELIQSGKQFYDNLLQGLQDLSVNLTDPLQMLLAVRRLGAPYLERRFGPGERRTTSKQGDGSLSDGAYEPKIASDTYLDFIERRDKVRTQVMGHNLTRAPQAKVVVGSADVHEYALSLVLDALAQVGVVPINAGTGVDPDEFAALAKDTKADVVLVSTHNGMALTYAQQLNQELAFLNISPLVAMGGTLNQDQEDTDAPIDVRSDLRNLGVKVCDEISDIVQVLRAVAA